MAVHRGRLMVDVRDARNQAIATAEPVRGNGPRPVRTPTLCLCKRRDRRGLAARMLIVHCERLRRWRVTLAPRATQRSAHGPGPR